MAEAETQSIYDLEHLPGHKEIQRPKYAVKYWPQSETCQRNPRKYALVAKSDNQRTIRNIMRRIDTENGSHQYASFRVRSLVDSDEYPEGTFATEIRQDDEGSFLLYVAYIPSEDKPEPNPRNEAVVKAIRYGAECTLAGDMKAALRGDGNKPKDIVQATGTAEQWKCRFDDPNVAFHSEQLHLWTEDRVYGFMQSDGCAVVVDMPRYPEPVERE